MLQVLNSEGPNHVTSTLSKDRVPNQGSKSITDPMAKEKLLRNITQIFYFKKY